MSAGTQVYRPEVHSLKRELTFITVICVLGVPLTLWLFGITSFVFILWATLAVALVAVALCGGLFVFATPSRVEITNDRLIIERRFRPDRMLRLGDIRKVQYYTPRQATLRLFKNPKGYWFADAAIRLDHFSPDDGQAMMNVLAERTPATHPLETTAS